MGTLAVRAAAEGFDVYLATPDKDAAQLVAPNIRLFRPGRAGDGAEIYDEARVKEHWGLVSPAQMIDWLALAGDASDNIPGIKGVGEKTASALLAQFGTVENLIAHAADLKGKVAEKVAAGAVEVSHHDPHRCAAGGLARFVRAPGARPRAACGSLRQVRA